MALNYQSKNYASDINSVYKITLDMSGWDKTTIQVQAPLAGQLYVYGTNDGGQTDYSMANAQLAQNFQPIQAVHLATGSAVSSIIAAGTYKVDINNQYLRLQGSPAGAGTSVYGLTFNHSKIS